MVTTVVLFLACGGCRSQQLGNDQNQFRQVLLTMYEDQLMDNLIRAKNRMPLLQLDYTNITGTVTHQGTASVGGGPMGTRTTTFVKPTAATAGGSLVRVASQAFSYGVNASQINQLTVTANPIVDNSVLYMAYVNFVERPGRLIESCDPPPDGAAHVLRQSGKKYYWVPDAYRNEFFELALRTNGVRTDPSDAAAYYEVTVTGMRDFVPKSHMPSKDDTVTVTLGIEKLLPKDDDIPNDSGVLIAVIKGREYRFRLVEAMLKDLSEDEQSKYKEPSKTGTKEEYKSGSPTRTIKLRYIYDPTVASNEERPDKGDLRSAPFTPAEIAEALANQIVKVDPDHYKPTAPRSRTLSARSGRRPSCFVLISCSS